MKNKQQRLIEALAYRISEVEDYQINIDNYTLAIAKIDAQYPTDPDLSGPFKSELQQRLQDEIKQQRRAIVIRDVISDQVDDLQVVPEAK